MDPEQIVAELEESAEDLETDANPQGTIALARVSEEIVWTFGVRREPTATGRIAGRKIVAFRLH